MKLLNKTILGVNDSLNEFMQGGIKIRTMLDYTKDIKRFQEHLKERGVEAMVQN